MVVGQRVLGGNLLELSVWAFFLLLFSLLCIAFLALIICAEVKLSFAVFESNNSTKTQVGENMNAKSFVLLDCQVVHVIFAGVACIICGSVCFFFFILLLISVMAWLGICAWEFEEPSFN